MAIAKWLFNPVTQVAAFASNFDFPHGFAGKEVPSVEVNTASVTDASLSAYLNWPRDNLRRLLAGVRYLFLDLLCTLFVE